MVEIVEQDYEKNKAFYLKIESVLKNVLGSDVRIEHVGSTAIPDMWGKNIIDVLVGATNSDEFLRLFEKIEDLGFSPSKNSRTEIYQFFASKQEETGSGDVHIHLVMTGTERFEEFVILRDYLLSNKKEAEDYAVLKKELLKNGVSERKEYRSKKSEYVSKLIERAKKNLKK